MSDQWVQCCIAKCHRRTDAQRYTERNGHPPGEWICRPHWRRLTVKERAVWRRVKRRWMKHEAPEDQVICDRVWAALKRRVVDV